MSLRFWAHRSEFALQSTIRNNENQRKTHTLSDRTLILGKQNSKQATENISERELSFHRNCLNAIVYSCMLMVMNGSGQSKRSRKIEISRKETKCYRSHWILVHSFSLAIIHVSPNWSSPDGRKCRCWKNMETHAVTNSDQPETGWQLRWSRIYFCRFEL